MSLNDLSPSAVLAAIRAGHNSKAKLATFFEVLPSSKWLHEVLIDLHKATRIKVHIEPGVKPDNYRLEPL